MGCTMVNKIFLFFFIMITASLDVEACSRENPLTYQNPAIEKMIQNILLFNADYLPHTITDEGNEKTKITTLHDNKTTSYNLLIVSPPSIQMVVCLYVPCTNVEKYKTIVAELYHIKQAYKGKEEGNQNRMIKELPKDLIPFLYGWIYKGTIDHTFIVDKVSNVYPLSIFYNQKFDVNLLLFVTEKLFEKDES